MGIGFFNVLQEITGCRKRLSIYQCMAFQEPVNIALYSAFLNRELREQKKPKQNIKTNSNLR